MSHSHRVLALSLALLCVFTLSFAAPEVRAEAPPTPVNLMVYEMGPQQLHLDWIPGAGGTDPVVFLVYRNGYLLTPVGIPETQIFYDDFDLAPDTPHTYTVQAENAITGERSPMSNRAAGIAMPGWEIRVPQEFPTIYDAVWNAQPGTTIFVSPGIYWENLDLRGRSGVTIKGQDPEGVILEVYDDPIIGAINLDEGPGTNNTLMGVTVSGGGVRMGQGDTVSNCVFMGGAGDGAVSGGGFVTNSIFDLNPMNIVVPSGEFMMVANSIFMMDGVIFHEMPPNGYLLNNNFVDGSYPPDIPGESEGNYGAPPCFENPIPDPVDPYPSFVPCWGPDWDAGADVGLPFMDTAPDVGAFELGIPWTPNPPSDPVIGWDDFQYGVALSWTLSPDDPFNMDPPPFPTPYPIDEYIIYRSDFPDMWGAMEIMHVPAGTASFVDMTAMPDTPYYYQVRASIYMLPPPIYTPWPIVSMPTITATTDPPQNLRLLYVNDNAVGIEWDPPFYTPPGPITYYNVFRNGKLVTPVPIWETSFVDSFLAPDTPHTYTVQAVSEDQALPPPPPPTPYDGFISSMSNRLGVMTADTGVEVRRVPQDFPTIQAAIDSVPSCTSTCTSTIIQVGPGVYNEELQLFGKSQIAIVGQDPQGVVLDLSMTPSLAVALDNAPGTHNTIRGFTITGGMVMMGEGDTVASCVFRDSSFRSVSGGGFVTNSVFDGYYSSPWPLPPVSVEMNEFMTVANSVFLGNSPYGSNPFELMMPDAGIYLLNNSFDQFDWSIYPGEGNFMDFPFFRPPGPPATYFIEFGIGTDNGADVGLPAVGPPDVGAFEFGLPYTPEPPSNLTADWNGTVGTVELSWTASPDDPFVNPGTQNPIMEYLIYRSDVPEFLPPYDIPIASFPPGMTIFEDFMAVPGTTYYYQVRANSGGPVPPEPGIISLPTNTASVSTNDSPVAVDDSYSVNKNDSLFVVPPGVLLNDTDPEFHPLTASLVSDVTNGWLNLRPLGDFDYTPFPGFSGTDSFTYVANDGTADSNVATVTITVVNQPPVAVDDNYSVNKNDSLFVVPPGVLLNDTDPEFDSLTASLVSDVTNGWLNLRPLGDFDYTPFPGFSGTDSFTYVANDGTADSNVATVTITVVNQPPVAVDDNYSVNKNDSLFVVPPGVLLNDTDPEFDPLTASLVSDVTNGWLNLRPLGDFDYTPFPGFSGTDSFTYVANDGTADSNVATVTITVVNQPPVAVDDNYSVNKNDSLFVVPPGVLLNDTDPEFDPLTASLVSDVTNGILSLPPFGDFSYTPNPGFSGTDSFTYVANDGTADSNVATVTITVVNQPPVAIDDNYSVNANDTLFVVPPGILLNDTDPEFDPLTASLVSDVTNGILSLPPFGDFSYTPNPGFSGTDSFTYVANDGTADSNVATVTITVVNQPPVAVDDSYSVDEDTLLAVIAPGVRQNDTNVQTVALVSGPGNAQSFTLNADGSFDYLPSLNFFGSDSFTYVGSDGTVDSNVATVTITVTRLIDDIHVESITMSTITGAKNKTHAVAEVLVQDELGAPMEGAGVAGHWEELTTDPEASTLTDLNGLVSFYSDELRKPTGTFTFVVDDVTLTDYTYDYPVPPASGSIDFPPGPVCTDADGDGYSPDGGDCGEIDCDDTDPAANPGAVEGPVGDPTCSDTVDNDCDDDIDLLDADCVVCTDADGDGYAIEGDSCGPVDCNDADPTVHPGATEGPAGDPTCSDTVDNDCDNLVDLDDPPCVQDCGSIGSKGACNETPGCIWEGSPKNGTCVSSGATCDDADGDGYGSPGDSSCPNGDQPDCDDTDPAVNPGATEGPVGDQTCSDTTDNDCDTFVDLQDADCVVCTDADGDGYAIEGDSCGPVDCNDADPAISPGATEGPAGDPTCSDSADNDCDGLTDDPDDPDCQAPPDCAQHTDKTSCNADAACRWDKKNEVCNNR